MLNHGISFNTDDGIYSGKLIKDSKEFSVEKSNVFQSIIQIMIY